MSVRALVLALARALVDLLLFPKTRRLSFRMLALVLPPSSLVGAVSFVSGLLLRLLHLRFLLLDTATVCHLHFHLRFRLHIPMLQLLVPAVGGAVGGGAVACVGSGAGAVVSAAALFVAAAVCQTATFVGPVYFAGLVVVLLVRVFFVHRVN